LKKTKDTSFFQGCSNLLLLLWDSHHILEKGKGNLQKCCGGGLAQYLFEKGNTVPWKP